jgi:hypothetical protein
MSVQPFFFSEDPPRILHLAITVVNLQAQQTTDTGVNDMGKKDKDCWKPEKHPTHMCKLFKKGLMMEIDQQSSKPTVACSKCGAKADVPESVCQPKAL